VLVVITQTGNYLDTRLPGQTYFWSDADAVRRIGGRQTALCANTGSDAIAVFALSGPAT